MKEIVLQLRIDGEQGIQTVRITKEELDKLLASATKVEDEFTSTYQAISREALKYNAISDQTVDSMADWIQKQSFTQANIEKTINELVKQNRALDINSKEWVNNARAAENIRAAYQKVTLQNQGLYKSQRPVVAGASQMNNAFGQLGYAIGDASMFMVDARIGMMSIANNIPMVVQMLSLARTEITSTGKSLKSALVASLMGPGGLMIAVNAVVLGMQILPSLFGDVTKSAKLQKEEIEKLKNEYKKLTKAQLENQLSKKLDDLKNMEFSPDFFDLLISGMTKSGVVYDRTIDGRVAKTVQEIGIIQETIKNLGIREDIQNRININQEKLNTLNKENYQTRVAEAKSYKEAEETLEKWIKADEKKLDILNNSDRIAKDENEKKIQDFERAQEHAYALAEFETDNELILLNLKKEQLQKRREEYEKYGKDVTEILYDLELVEVELAKKSKPSPIVVEDPDDLFLDDIAKKGDTNKYDKSEQAKLDRWYLREEEKIRQYSNYNQMKIALDEEYRRKSEEIDTKILLSKIATYGQIVNAAASAFNQIYSAAEMNVSRETQAWKTKENRKLDTERKIALKHARTSQQREKVNEQYDKKQEKLENEAQKRAKEKLIVWFRLKQAGDIAATTMSTYKASTSALEPPPVGLGPIYGWPLKAAIIAGGLANVAIIASQKITAYEHGGILPKGKQGFFEGYENEIVAPEKSFAQAHTEIMFTTMNVLQNELRTGNYSPNSSNNSELLSEMKQMRSEFTKLAGGGIKAYVSERGFRKAYKENQTTDMKQGI